MLRVTFYRDSLHRLSSVISSGHVEIAETSSDEYSLVCAAVSAILQAARLGLQAHANVALDVEQRTGFLRIRWPESSREDAAVRAIVATAELAVEQISRQYPQHLSIEHAQDERL